MGTPTRLSYLLSLCFLHLNHLLILARCNCPGSYLKPYPGLMASLQGSCQWENAVLLTDNNLVAHDVLKDLTSSGIPLCHLDLTSLSRRSKHSRIQQAYAKGWTKFLVVTTSPADVIPAAEAVFQSGSRRGVAAMPHKSQWLIVTWTKQQVSEAIKEYNTSSFDNVALVSVTPHAHKTSRLSVQPVRVLTSIWSAKRVRTFQRVLPADLDSATCRMFPNIYNGLNQRRLDILTKKDLGQIVTISEDKARYEGYLIDLLPEMAQILNFTYTLSPEPRYDLNMTWGDYFYAVSDGLVDMGLSIWTEQPLSDKLVDVSSAIIQDINTGIYKRPPIPYTLYMLFPFPPPVYVILAIGVLFATAMYIVLDFVSTKALNVPPEENKTASESEHHCLQNRESVASNSIYRYPYQVGRKLADRGLKRFVPLLAVFAVAVINHSYFPLPKFMSTRMVIWSWCMTIVVFYALYTSSMTAEIVAGKRELPFDTYQELVDNGDYRWATFALTYNQTSFSAIRTPPFDKLNDRMEVSDYNMDAIDHLLNNDYVLMYAERFMKLVLSDSAYFDDLVFMKNKLIRASFGLIFPFGSELRDVISSALDKMHQAGLINRHIEMKTHHFNAKAKEDQKQRTVVLRDLSYPFLVILGMLLIAVVCLGMERVLPWLILKRRRTHGDKMAFPDELIR